MKAKYLMFTLLMSGCAVGLDKNRVDGLVELSSNAVVLKMAENAVRDLKLDTPEWRYAHNRVKLSMESVKSCLSNSVCLTLSKRLIELESDINLVSERRVRAMGMIDNIRKQLPKLEYEIKKMGENGNPELNAALVLFRKSLLELTVALTDTFEPRFIATEQVVYSNLTKVRNIFYGLTEKHKQIN